MKIVSIWISCCMFLACAVNNKKYFSNIQVSTNKSYGYKADNPINIWNGNINSSLISVNYFLSHLKTIKGNKLIINKRYTVTNPLFSKYEAIKNSSSIVQLNTYGHRPMIDLYEMIVENEEDTIRLYINPYMKSRIMVPFGLKLE